LPLPKHATVPNRHVLPNIESPAGPTAPAGLFYAPTSGPAIPHLAKMCTCEHIPRSIVISISDGPGTGPAFGPSAAPYSTATSGFWDSPFGISRSDGRQATESSHKNPLEMGIFCRISKCLKNSRFFWRIPNPDSPSISRGDISPLRQTRPNGLRWPNLNPPCQTDSPGRVVLFPEGGQVRTASQDCSHSQIPSSH